jgi:hypothetical protein
MRRAAKVDTIHPHIRALFHAHGVAWRTLAGHGLPDALISWGGKLALLEIKSGSRGVKGTKTKTAEAQRRFALDFPVRLITNEMDAIDTIRWLKDEHP